MRRITTLATVITLALAASSPAAAGSDAKAKQIQHHGRQLVWVAPAPVQPKALTGPAASESRAKTQLFQTPQGRSGYKPNFSR